MNKRLLTAVYVGSLGGFIFGYDLGALSAASQSIQAHFHLSPWAFGLTISSSVWGTVCGSIAAGRLADRIDRRTLIALSSLLYAVGALGVMLTFSSDWLFVLALRCLCGVAIGGFTVGCPLYLSEIAPLQVRGRVVGAFQVQVGAGVISAFSVGALCVHLATSGALWRWCLGLGVLPASALLLLVRWMLPVELATPDHHGTSITGPSSPFATQPALPRLFQSGNARLLLIATSIALFNQLSGVNILLLYMLEILASAGMGLSLGHTYTVLISGLSLITTVVGLAFVDRLGRKPLLYVGSAGMAACLTLLAITIPRHLAPSLYLAIYVTYNAFFAFSQGTVVWVYLSELFPPGLRGVGQGYGSSVHWVANAVLISVFPMMQRASSVWIFYIFAVMMIVHMVVIKLAYPETRGVALGFFATGRSPVANRLG